MAYIICRLGVQLAMLKETLWAVCVHGTSRLLLVQNSKLFCMTLLRLLFCSQILFAFESQIHSDIDSLHVLGLLHDRRCDDSKLCCFRKIHQ